MNIVITFILACTLLSAVSCTKTHDPHEDGEWKVTFLTPKHLVLTGNYAQLMAKRPDYNTHRLRPAIVENLQRHDSVAIHDQNQQTLRADTPMGYWLGNHRLLRTEAGEITKQADVLHYLFITLNRSLMPQEHITVTILGKKQLDAVYDPQVPSPLFKINQVGNGLKAPRKFAYLGAWRGTAGPFPMRTFWGKKFDLVNAESGQTVFSGTIRRRLPDPRYKGITPFTGEEVGELDYSPVCKAGHYYLKVNDLGRSLTFRIGNDTLNEDFYIHARGLYHKRCGIAKSTPFTQWTSPACHLNVIRGTFPSDESHYRPGKEPGGFTDAAGKRISVKHFDLIKENPPMDPTLIQAPGGWHDAADYDRRPQHLRIVADLATLFLLKPENFLDRQLAIPESGNGIPDLLDEAAWGLKHLRAVQTPEGAVGTWFETTGHPQTGEGLPNQDRHAYFVSAPGCSSSLEYAAAASTLALAFSKASCPQEAQEWSTSARKAWDYAQNPSHRLIRNYRYHGGTIHYEEEERLPAEFFLKTAVNLFLLTGKEEFLTPALKDFQRIRQDWQRLSWRWSPWTWLNLHLFRQQLPMLADFRREHQRHLLHLANKMVMSLDLAYPYRPLWPEHDAPWVHAMAWGNAHPLKQAMLLVAAHAITGAPAYLDAIYLANDYHNGANPLGRSMTSGLGTVYPTVFLDLVSYADGIAEFVPGITPYGNTFGIDRHAIRRVYGFFERSPFSQQSLFPQTGLTEQECAKAVDRIWPIWRRCVNLEMHSVPASEYSVWETIAPAAATTGYLLEKPQLPADEWRGRIPAQSIQKLPGFMPLP